MNEQMKIHKLCNELIPFYDEVEESTKEIIEEHIEQCSDCRGLLESFQTSFPSDIPTQSGDASKEEEVPSIKPFKTLIHFKNILFTFFILIRFLVLGLIANNWVNNVSLEQGALLPADLILLYFPFVALTNGVTFMFYRKMGFWLVLAFDILMLLFFDNLIVFLQK